MDSRRFMENGKRSNCSSRKCNFIIPRQTAWGYPFSAYPNAPLGTHHRHHPETRQPTSLTLIDSRLANMSI